MLIALVSVVVVALICLFWFMAREECYRCRKRDWLMNMLPQEMWLADEDKPRIQYFHIEGCRRKPVGEFRRGEFDGY